MLERKNWRARRGLVLVAVCTGLGRALASPAAETGPPEDRAPRLEELVALALARSPEVGALAARLEAAREMVRPASALPDPMVEAMLQDVSFPRLTVGGEEMSMVGVEIRQDLLFPGKRRARAEAARAESRLRGRELGALRRELVVRVRSLYARLYLLDAERSALGAGRQMLELLAETARARYSAGSGELEAMVKPQITLSRLGERLDDLTAERRATVAALNRMLDAPDNPPVGLVASLPEPSPPPIPAELARLAVVRAPAVVVARAALEAAQSRVALARKELRPNLSVLGGYFSRGGLDPVVTLRVGVELPLWRGEKQLPALQSALFEERSASESLRAAEAEARAEGERLGAEWERSEAQLRRYHQAILPQSSVLIDAARAAYAAGRGDFVTVIDDFNMWLEARVDLARRELERFVTWAAIDALVGAEPDPGEGGRP